VLPGTELRPSRQIALIACFLFDSVFLATHGLDVFSVSFSFVMGWPMALRLPQEWLRRNSGD
jgi:hypothetical protein